MLSPFDSPIGKSLVRMMAETTVFEQQGGQQQGQGGGGGGNPSTANSCYNNNYQSYFQKVYEDSANNYRIYQIWNNSGGYEWFSWDGSSAPTSLQITNMKRHLNGLKANGDSRCVLPSNPGFTLLNTSLGQYDGWKTYRDLHESANAGCTDSNASNYDSTALTLDNSCQFYEDNWSSGYSTKSQTFSDGVRFESKRKLFRRPIPNNQAESYYESTIEKVCLYNSCAVNGVKETTVAWTQTTPTFTWTSSDRTDLDSAKAASKTAIDNAMASLEAGYVPNCTLTQQSPTQYKKETACDGTSFSITQTNFTSNCNGSVEKIVYSFSNGESYTWEKSSGITSSAFKTSNPPDSRAGYGGLADRLLTLVDNHNKGLGSVTEMAYEKRYENSRGVVGQKNGQQLVIVVEAYEVIEDACGKKSRNAGSFYGYTYVYDYSPSLRIRPVYDGLDDLGVPIVTYNSTVIPPTTTFGPFEELPLAEDLVGKVVIGCTDPTATNYDEKANTPTMGFIGKCKYEESEGDGNGNGNGNGNGSGLEESPLVEPTPTFSPLLLIPAALLAVGLIVKNK